MNTKAISLTAIVSAAALAITPISGAIAATSAPATAPAVVVASSTVTPAAVLKNVAAAPAAATVPAALGAFVVVTDEAVQGATAAASTATAQAAAIELPTVPQSVTDILNVAGLPVQAVYRVLQTSQGVYTIWYKMLTSVPRAIFKGEFGSVPTLFQTAIANSLTWIATGSGPKVPTVPETAATASTEAAAAPNPITAGLDVLGIPVATAFAGGQAALSIYKSFYGLLTSVPRAVFQGKFGDAVNLVADAVSKSVTTIVEFPGAQIKAASAKIDALVASLTPAVKASTVTSDPVARTSVAGTDELALVTAPAGTATGEQKPAAEKAKPVAETAKPTIEVASPVAETAKPVVVETPKPATSKPATSKPAAEPTVTEPSEPTQSETPAEQSKPTVESKPSAEPKAEASKSAAEATPDAEPTPAAESGAKPDSSQSAEGSTSTGGSAE